MWGDSESAIFKYPKYSNIRIFENSLASDLVFVSLLTVLIVILSYLPTKLETVLCKYSPDESHVNTLIEATVRVTKSRDVR